MLKVEMIEKLDCVLSMKATRPHIYEHKCACVRTHLCIDPSSRQQSPVTSGYRRLRPIMQ